MSLDKAAIKQAAHGNWDFILTSLGVSAETLTKRNKPCPACGGTDRFSFDDKFGNGNFICRGMGEQISGDGFQLLQHLYGWRFGDALREVARVLGINASSPTPRREMPKPQPKALSVRDTLDETRTKYWQNLDPVRDAGLDYLRARGCVIPPVDGDLRFAPRASHKDGHTGPALVALITDALTKAPKSLHWTFVSPDGTRPCDREMLAGHSASGVIRLWPDEAVTTGLGVAEGIETALSLAHLMHPVWATVTAGNMKKLPPLPGIEILTVGVDADEAGRDAAEHCAQAWVTAGHDVRLIEPERDGDDLNDFVRRAA
jgi:putative DNA primase/helicase